MINSVSGTQGPFNVMAIIISKSKREIENAHALFVNGCSRICSICKWDFSKGELWFLFALGDNDRFKKLPICAMISKFGERWYFDTLFLDLFYLVFIFPALFQKRISK